MTSEQRQGSDEKILRRWFGALLLLVLASCGFTNSPPDNGMVCVRGHDVLTESHNQAICDEWVPAHSIPSGR